MEHDQVENMRSTHSGNCSFEVVLSPARVLESPRASHSPATRKTSAAEIQEKLRAAEERRTVRRCLC